MFSAALQQAALQTQGRDASRNRRINVEARSSIARVGVSEPQRPRSKRFKRRLKVAPITQPAPRSALVDRLGDLRRNSLFNAFLEWPAMTTENAATERTTKKRRAAARRLSIFLVYKFN